MTRNEKTAIAAMLNLVGARVTEKKEGRAKVGPFAFVEKSKFKWLFLPRISMSHLGQDTVAGRTAKRNVFDAPLSPSKIDYLMHGLFR